MKQCQSNWWYFLHNLKVRKWESSCIKCINSFEILDGYAHHIYADLKVRTNQAKASKYRMTKPLPYMVKHALLHIVVFLYLENYVHVNSLNTLYRQVNCVNFKDFWELFILSLYIFSLLFCCIFYVNVRPIQFSRAVPDINIAVRWEF